MPDPIRKCFDYCQLRPLRPACSQNQAALYICWIRLPSAVSVPFFLRSHGSYRAIPTQTRSGWPGQGLANSIWSGSKLMCRNHRARVSGRTQPAPLPVSHFQTRLRSSADVPDNTVQNQPGSGLVLADCVSFWPNGPGPEGGEPMRKNHPARFWPMLSSRSGPDANRIRHVYWAVTNTSGLPTYYCNAVNKTRFRYFGKNNTESSALGLCSSKREFEHTLLLTFSLPSMPGHHSEKEQ